ncbi:MAG: alginate export family protein, partial [Rhizorhabdus sp.]
MPHRPAKLDILRSRAARTKGRWRMAVMASCVALAAPAQAQDKSGWLHDALDLPGNVILSGSSRWRYEALDGQSRAGFGLRDDLVSIRTTLLGEYRGDGFRIGAEVYDSRAYGANRGSAISTSEVNALELVQAYVAAKDVALPMLGAKADVQLGRFMLDLGGRRLVAADDYRNTTNGFTGIRVDLRGTGGTRTTLFYTLPQQRRPDDNASIRDNEIAFDKESFDLRLWGGLVSRPAVFGKTMAEISYFGLAERDMAGRPNRNRHLHSVGGRLLLAPAAGPVDYELEGIYQFGRIRASTAATAASLDVSAWFTHAETGYSFTGPLKARL